MVEVALGERYPAFTGKVEEKNLRREFLRARMLLVKAFQERKLGMLQKLPYLGEFGENLEKHEEHCSAAFERYMAVYATNHSDAQTRSRRAYLASETGYLKRTNAAQHFYGRALSGSIAYAGRKTRELVSSKEGKISKRALLLLAAGAIAAIFVGSQFVTTYIVAFYLKRIVVGIGMGLAFRYLLPLILSRLSPFQHNPEKLAKVRSLFGWLRFVFGFGIGFYIAPDLSAGLMHHLPMQSPDEHLSETARHALADQIDQKRGAPTFLHIDKRSDQALQDQLNATASDDAALRDSPDLARILRNLKAFESHKTFLKNDQAAFVRQGVDLMQDLRTQEDILLRGGRYDAATLQHLAEVRGHVRDWNKHFETATQDAEGEYQKNFAELAMEYAHTQPVHQQPLPLQYYLANPATLSEIRIAHGGPLTPQDLVTAADRIHGRLMAINRVIYNYEHTSAHVSMNDRYYRGLIGARGEYAYWDTRVHEIAAMTNGMPANQPIVVHDGVPGQDLRNTEILNAVHQTNFSRYESSWGQVMAAEHHFEQVGSNQTLVDGKIMNFRRDSTHHDGIVSFKDGVRSDLAPAMRADLTGATLRLARDGYTLFTTEGWKLSDPLHISQCHFDGTCVDFRGPKSGEEIYTYFKDLSPTARRLLLEANTVPERDNLQHMLWDYLTRSTWLGGRGMSDEAARAWIRQYVESKGGIEFVKHATGTNWHYEPLDGNAPVAPVRLDEEPGL